MHVVHVIFRLHTGGLENGLVNLINSMSLDIRHSIICLQGATAFRDRIQRPDVTVHDIGKPDGASPAYLWRLLRLIRGLKPDVLHTRNLNTLECQLAGWLARVPVRIHGEHGWDIIDPDGRIAKYRRLRRLINPLLSRWLCVSRQLQEWLVDSVGIPANKVCQLYNGVDLSRFSDAPGKPADWPFADDLPVLVGVGRMEVIKDPLNLVDAWLAMVRAGSRCHLVMVGAGSLRDEALRRIEAAGLAALAWLPGDRSDVPLLLANSDVFALPSRNEGISNTILEAMACSLPVVATQVGGNPELVLSGVTGALVAPGDSAALADALSRYLVDPELRRSHGAAGRQRCEQSFSLNSMVAAYESLYRSLTGTSANNKGSQSCVV